MADERMQRVGKGMKRRGILAAAGAVVAGMVAKRAAQPVGATDVPVLMATSNPSIGSPINNPVDAVTFYATSDFDTAIATGVIEAHTSKDGMQAFDAYDDHSGVAVRAQSKGTGGIGVYSQSNGVYGVYGISSMSGGCGVRGDCTGGYGVLGSVSDGYGVLGQANTGNGLYGFSQQNHAVVGQTARPYFGGVVGYATLDQTVGIYGTTNGGNGNNANAFAGYMDGNFVVAHGVKSAAVPHPDGTHRLVYCVESPDAWFEDFGEAQLVGGKADVKLDADFAAVVDTSVYHVFLTPKGESKGLYVSAQSAGGFSVREQQGGGSSLAFSWRAVAKRKDLKPGRLAKVELPGKAKAGIAPLDVPKPPPAPPQPPRKP